jgi:hypothetical protein
MVYANYLKKGFVILMIYLLVTLVILAASNRIERLDQNNNLEEGGAISLVSNK